MYTWYKGCPGRMVVGFTTTYAISVAITTKVVSSNPLDSWRGVFDTTLYDKVCQWLATGQLFSPGTLISSTNKTDHHDISLNFYFESRLFMSKRQILNHDSPCQKGRFWIATLCVREADLESRLSMSERQILNHDSPCQRGRF